MARNVPTEKASNIGLLADLERVHRELVLLRDATAGDTRIAFLHYLIGNAAAEAARRVAGLRQGHESQWT
jgi:hypothetical protein